MTSTATVVQAWEDRCRALGVTIVSPAPLLHPDPSVLVVNAGITPFKPAMLCGAELPPTAVVQPCLRTYWNNSGRFAFDMLTMVGMAQEAGRASHLAAALVARLGLARRRLRCVVDRRDDDIAEHALIMCDADAIELQESNNDLYWTRWHFGEKDLLLGRGLTLIHIDDDGRRLSLGNLILVDHPPSGRRYVDLGFGVERLASIAHAGDEWEPTPVATAITRLVGAGMARDHACALANQAIAAARLIDAGAFPDARGTGYLVRKLVRVMVDAAVNRSIAGDSAEQAVECLLVDLGGLLNDNRSACTVIAAEAANYVCQVARSRRALLKRSRRIGASPANLDPVGTYGLPSWARV